MKYSLEHLPAPSDLPEGYVTRLNRSIQVFLGMGQRDEPSFKLGRWQIDPLLHHLNEELGKLYGIAHLGILIIPDRSILKEEGKHSRRLIDRDG